MATITRRDFAKTRQRIRQVLGRKCWARVVVDESDNSVGRCEIDIVARLLQGDELVQGRLYVKEVKAYCTYCYWHDEGYTRQDLGVHRLLSRGIIRPVRCAGGFTWMKLTKAAKVALRAMPNKPNIERNETEAMPRDLEELVRDERWGTFWFFRPIMIGPLKKQRLVWQVWDFENEWYPNNVREAKLIVDDAPSQIVAAQAALTKGTP